MSKKDNLLQCYKDMLLIRRFEERSGQLYGMGMIAGFCHLYIGQEAVAIGMQTQFIKGDAIITGYRDHGHMLACGTDPKVVLAELMGREAGCSKGKGGSMHMFDLERGFYGGHGIVGSQASIGTGIAFAQKYNNTNNVCFAYFGDGASNQGQVFESFNMAALWKLPVVYIIENNQYAMGTSLARSTAETDLSKRGLSLGIKGIKVNGMDIEDVITKGKEAVDHCRQGKGPMLLEMMTYRYRGHSMSDPAKYRSKDEVDGYKDNQDPIENLRNKLITSKITTEEELKNMDKKIRDEIAEIVEFCKNNPEPEEGELYTDVYND